ncbi:fluoride efflux transporter CrcB [Campylobacter coli]|uniref:fluoride efflux transporter CrcB n=1 Tax=Campylobacter TaxID=194 RepID=UPI00069C4763|nr:MULTISPECIES: fluoride efflux transporter CrcB [Campylobacter]ELG2213372.1 fluoride efflux transporter CrcB [Campylobacter jejuni]EAH4669884.1 fluoride efflux transporter CrcB [Campylobacter coli]EAH4931718.1 fluoride efflux transporter CrcB [Campylobacter coli]EAH4986108.1 fluoride efflux transporter CrcB [Campylobacter coli]EAH5016819.1 fluoride efflux transporter CrcB [Campylobacter coli]
MLNTLLIVGFGGFIGAILRMLSINLVNKFFPYSISFGTLFVNVLGSFIIGLLFSYAQNKGLSPVIKSFISTGFLGAFTTFSTFSYENLLLLQSGNYFNFSLNILLNIILCLIAVWLGFIIFK